MFSFVASKEPFLNSLTSRFNPRFYQQQQKQEDQQKQPRVTLSTPSSTTISSADEPQHHEVDYQLHSLQYQQEKCNQLRGTPGDFPDATGEIVPCIPPEVVSVGDEASFCNNPLQIEGTHHTCQLLGEDTSLALGSDILQVDTYYKQEVQEYHEDMSKAESEVLYTEKVDQHEDYQFGAPSSSDQLHQRQLASSIPISLSHHSFSSSNYSKDQIPTQQSQSSTTSANGSSGLYKQSFYVSTSYCEKLHYIA